MRFPEGPLACRLGTSQEGSSSPRTVPGTGFWCRSRVWPLRTWYSIPASLLSGSSAPSSADPFCPSWELLPESVLLLRDESRESSSVRSMVVTGMDVAERRLELCAEEGAECECGRKVGRGAGGSRDLPHVTPRPSAGDWRGGARDRGTATARNGGEVSELGRLRENCSAFTCKTHRKWCATCSLPFSSPQFTPGCSKHPVRSRGNQQHTRTHFTGETEARRGCNVSEATWPGHSRSAVLQSPREALAPGRPSPAGELAGP